MQPADLLQTKRIIPDLPTWLQCFSVYAAVLLTKFPQRATSLLLYQKNIADLSQRFLWPSWVIYDNSFRQEAAETKRLDWSQLDYGLHARCFHNQASALEGWCSTCLSVDHLQANCPLAKKKEWPNKRPSTVNPPSSKRFMHDATPICRSFNSGDGSGCQFTPKCNYRHVCLSCQGTHPKSRCHQSGQGSSKF